MKDLATYPKCKVCRNPMTVGQKVKHYLCDPTTLIGRFRPEVELSNRNQTQGE